MNAHRFGAYREGTELEIVEISTQRERILNSFAERMTMDKMGMINSRKRKLGNESYRRSSWESWGAIARGATRKMKRPFVYRKERVDNGSMIANLGAVDAST